MTTLHAGGKFSNKVYQTSGGLHGVGISVVNALSEFVDVEIYRDKKIYNQKFSKGHPTSKLKELKKKTNRKGTKVSFKPDPEIFGLDNYFNCKKLYDFSKSKAYLLLALRLDGSVKVKSQKKKIFLKMMYLNFQMALLI